MENLGKKVGYLKGLMEGMDIDSGSANGKLLSGIVQLLGDLSDRIEAMDELLDDLNDYVESIDDDLAELEGGRREDGDGMGFFDDDDEDFDDAFGDGEDKLHLLRPDESSVPDQEEDSSEGDDDGDAALAGKLCPKCGRMFFTALDDAEDAEYICPHCGERVAPALLTPENAPIARPAEE